MNFKTTFILLAALIVVGATALIVMKRAPNADLAPVDHTLLSVKAADVTSIAIENSDGGKIVVGRASSIDPWTISQPISAKANGDAISTIVNDLTGLVSTNETTLAPDQLKDYGLDTPQYKVRLTAGDKDISLLIGNTQSIGGGVYVEQENSGKLDVVGAQGLLPDLQKKVADLRDKKLVDLTSIADLNTVTITKPDGNTVTVTRDTSIAPWRISAPTSMPADNSAVETLLNPLVSLSATSFVDDPTTVSASRLAPQLTITYTPNAPFSAGTTKPAAQPSTTIVFGQYDDLSKTNIYVQVGASKVVAKIPGSTLASFDKKPLDLRDKNVLTIDPSMVSKIALTTEIPATTTAPLRPAISMGFSLSRRPESHILGPALPAGLTPPTTASTQSASATTTGPTTDASTQPATAPAVAVTTAPVVPPSTWVVDSPAGDADDDAVQNLLTALNPLTVDHYIDKLPTTVPSHTYRLTVTTVGPGGSPTTDYSIELIDPNGIDAPYGTYNGVPFVAQRMLITDLQSRFVKSAPATQPAATQP